MKKGKFELKRESPSGVGKDYYYFHLKSGNGKIIAQSETYNTKAAALKGIAAIKRLAADAEVVEL